MARSKTYSAKNMVQGEVADGTQVTHRVMEDRFARQKLEEWTTFNADNEAWRTDHPGQLDPKLVALADPDNPTMQEKVFVEVRVAVFDELGKASGQEVLAWVQNNATNFPSQGAGHLGDIKEIHDVRRADASLAPA